MRAYGKSSGGLLMLMAASLMASGSGVSIDAPRKRIAVKSYKKELPPNNPRREKYKKKRNRIGK